MGGARLTTEAAAQTEKKGRACGALPAGVGGPFPQFCLFARRSSYSIAGIGSGIPGPPRMGEPVRAALDGDAGLCAPELTCVRAHKQDANFAKKASLSERGRQNQMAPLRAFHFHVSDSNGNVGGR